MAKEKTDEFDLDGELDFGDFDFGEIDSQVSEEAKDKKSRNPVTDVFSGTISGAKQAFTDPSFLARATRDALPASYGSSFEAADKAASSIAQLYDDAVREIKPQAQNLAKKVDRLVPDESKRLKALTTKIKDKLGVYDESQMPSREQIREEGMNQSLASIFQMQQNAEEQQREVQAKENVEEKIRDEIETKRFDQNQDLLGKITEGVTTLSSYTTKITQSVQKKGLELQYRTFFAISDLVEHSKKFFEVSRIQNESIVKNTALPEFVKIRNNERFRELMKTKFMDKIQSGLFNNNFVDTAMKRLRGQVDELVSGLKQGMELASEGISGYEEIKNANQMAAEFGQAPTTKANLAGQVIGGVGAGWIRDKFTGVIRKITPEDSAVARFGEKARDFTANIPGYAEERLKQDDLASADMQEGFEGVKNRAKRWFWELFRPEAADMELTRGTDLKKLDEPGLPGQSRADRSLIDIIPGYLSRIHREIVMFRTGTDNAPLTTYDYQTGKFVSTKTLAADLKSQLSNRIKSSGMAYKLDTAAKQLDDTLSPDESKAIQSFLYQRSLGTERNTPENIVKSQEFRALDPAIQKKLIEILQKKITNNELSEKGQADLTEMIKNIRETHSDFRGELESFVKAGYGDILEEEGLVKRNKSGGFDVHDENMHAFAKKEINIDSDIDLKQSVSKLNPKEMLRGIKNTKLYNWMYKSFKKDDTQYQGPMAGDLNRSMGEEFAPNGEKVNLTNMNAANMAAIQELDRRQSKLDGQGDNYLKKIQVDVAAIRKMLKGAKPTAAFAGAAASTIAPTEDSYKGHLGNIIGSVTSIIGKASSEMFQSAKKVADFALNKIAKPVGKAAKDVYDNNKDSVVEIGKKVWNKAFEMGGRMLGTAQRFLFGTIPEFAGKVKKFAGKAIEKITGWLEGPVDVFRKGIKSPILQANLMRMGYYRDKATGAVIKSFNDIKGPVVDAFGKTVLTAEDIAEGLVDEKGKPLISKLGRLAAGARDYIIAGGKRVLQAGKKVAEFLGNSKPGKWLKEKLAGVKMPEVGLNGGKSYEVLVQIRDILRKSLLGEDLPMDFTDRKLKTTLDGVQNEIPTTEPDEATQKQEVASKDNSVKSVLQRTLQKGKTKLGAIFGESKSKDGATAEEGTGTETTDTSSESKSLSLKDRFKNFKTGLRKKLGKFAAPVMSTVPTSIAGVGQLDQQAEAREKQQAKLDEAVEQAKEAAGPQYQGPNVIDTMMNKGKSWLEKGKQAFNKITSPKDQIDINLDELDSNGGGKNKKRTLSDRLKTAKDKVKDKFANTKKQIQEKMESPETKAKTTRAKRKAKVALGRGKKFGKGLLGGALGAIGSLFGGGSSSVGETEEEETEEQTTKKKEPVEVELKGKPQGDASKATFNDRDGSGRRDGSAQDRLDQQEDERKKRQAKLDAAIPDAAGPKYKGPNVIDTMMQKASGFFSFLKDGIGGVLGTAMNLFGMVGGAGGLLAKIGGGIKGVFGGAAAGVKGAAGLLGKVGGAAKGAAAAVPGAAKLGAGALKVANVARTGLMIGSLMTGGAMSAVTGIAAAGISALAAALSSPVIIGAAVVAGIAYAGYKGYKYYTRNNTNEFEDIRVKQYGLTNKDDDISYNQKVLELEGYLVNEGVVGYNRDQAYILEKKIDIEKIFGIFGIDKQNKEQVNNFTTWFNSRFKPFFLGSCTALFAIDKKAKLTEVQKLTTEQKLTFVEVSSQDSGPYSELTSPFPGKEYLTNTKFLVQEAVKALLAKLTQERKEKNKGKQGSQSPVTPVKPTPPPKTDIEKKEEKPATLPKSQTDKKEDTPSIVGEDGAPPKEAASQEPGSTSPTGKLKIAPGPLKDGQAGMQFIQIAPGENIDGLSPSVLKNLTGMAEEYGEKTGKKIPINSGSRTFEQQAELHRKNPKKAAKPGRSLHEFGFAIDSNTPVINELEEMGLMRKYGFTRPVGGETWHMEPAGIQTSLSLVKADPESADDLAKISVGRGGGGVGSIPGTPLGKRNGELATKLWNETAQKTEEKDPKKSISTKLESGQQTAENKQETEKTRVSNVVSIKPDIKPNIKPTISPKLQPNTMTAEAANDGEVKPKEMSTASVPKTKEEVKKVIEKTAVKAGSDPTEAVTMAAVESGLNPRAAAKNTSAKGPFQFIDRTWNEQMGKHAAKYDIPSGTTPFDVEASTLLASEYMKSNKAFMRSVKQDLGFQDVYLAHLLGAGGARRILKALKDRPDVPAATVSPDQADKNRSLFFDGDRALTVREFYENIGNLLQRKAGEFGIKPKITMTALNDEATRVQAAKKTEEKSQPIQAAEKANTAIAQKDNKPIEQIAKPERKKLNTSVFQPPPSAFSVVNTGSTKAKGENLGTTISLDDTNNILRDQLTTQQGMQKTLLDILTAVSSLSASPEKPAEQPKQTPQPNRPTPRSTNPVLSLKRSA